MAHKKGQGSSTNGRESQAQRLGIKKYAGEKVIAGNIIVRQNGTKIHPALNFGIGKAREVADARAKAFTNAKKSLKKVPLKEDKVSSIVS